MSETFKNSTSQSVVKKLVDCIKSHATYLSEIDGKIGDGDHGINMQKGFSIVGKRIEGKNLSYSEAMTVLGDVLLSEIGGSMGPIYGSYFMELGSECDGMEEIDKQTYLKSFEVALEAVMALGSAKLGDKTMLDALIPGVNSLRTAINAGKPFAVCLDEMTHATRRGMESTKDMIAKVGRSARLGERSRGVLDAGAVSCSLIIETMGESIKDLLGHTGTSEDF